TLFTTEASIDQLKQTILQLAVMGKLVPQDPTDEPAAKLLERIAEEKAQLIKDKKIKKQKALLPIAEDEKPFELPMGWEWCRFEDVVDIQSGITKGRKLVNRALKTIPYLSVANVQRGFLNLSNVKEIELPVDELEKFGVQNGDLLIT
ncbi:restriction endonuclease subunit S, partial [Vibrio sp. 10N.222.55.E8]